MEKKKSCGAYFTAVLYVEHLCEEHFNRLTLGSPDFSHADVVILIVYQKNHRVTIMSWILKVASSIWNLTVHGIFFFFFSYQELVLSINHASKESAEYIYSTIIKLQVLISCVSSSSILQDITF
ncbi:hypothetical protein RHSIM_Rhsim02G0102500 [Rhododendron simsii]|uniref:Uncharacterized protein n=1 Tax=Rhododendron simsii TaxID=118357 RepID=A0A834HA30_RHOSS|nr:hypothetical protein RHSIM_Rhsim02G0102500 [Rhododendron simsii]